MNIVDANNYLRILIEANSKFSILRHLLFEIQAIPNVIVVWDGFNANAYRRQFWPGYKVGRNVPDKSVFDLFKVCKPLFQAAGLNQVQVDGYEADDVIAQLVRMDTDKSIQKIYSTDLDLAGLGVPTLSKKVVPERLTLYKTMVGDTSDKIPGLRGFGPAKWEALDSDTKDLLEAYFKGESSIFPDQFEEHRELLQNFWNVVKFRDVPEELLVKGWIAPLKDEWKVKGILDEHRA